MTIFSPFRWILRTLNGETWGSGAAHVEGASRSRPSEDLPGIENKAEALPSNMNQWP